MQETTVGVSAEGEQVAEVSVDARGQRDLRYVASDPLGTRRGVFNERGWHGQDDENDRKADDRGIPRGIPQRRTTHRATHQTTEPPRALNTTRPSSVSISGRLFEEARAQGQSLDPALTRAPDSDPFGRVEGSPSSAQPWSSWHRFAGHRYESKSGLVNASGRIYDSENAVFLSPDPVVASAGVAANPYAYALHNPTRYTDSTGYWPNVDCVNGSCVGGGGGTAIAPPPAAVGGGFGVTDDDIIQLVLAAHGTLTGLHGIARGAAMISRGTADAESIDPNLVIANFLQDSGVSDYLVGIGDSVTGGVIAEAREYVGINGTVDTESTAYAAGQWTGVATAVVSLRGLVVGVVRGVGAGVGALRAMSLQSVVRAPGAVLRWVRGLRGAGAGGSWKTVGARSGGAVAQATTTSCGAACGEMLTGMSQSALIESAGAPTNVSLLARALGAGWRGGYVGPSQLARLLGLGRPFAAELYDGGRLGHLVVVDGVEAGHVLIRDPWAGGSTYRMAIAEFERVWTGSAVFR